MTTRTLVVSARVLIATGAAFALTASAAQASVPRGEAAAAPGSVHAAPMDPAPLGLGPTGLTVGPATPVKSHNWAGYVDRGHTFSVVRSTWKQPRVTCTSTDAIAAFWVGLDGYRSKTVEQDGTLAYCHNGKPTYYTWWEMYPRNNVQLVHAGVQPGDKVTSSVVRHGTKYTLKVVDHTHPGNSFKKITTCATCADSSAEWIAERVTGAHGFVPLAHYTKIAFFGNKVGVGKARGSIAKYAHDAITMVNAGGSLLAGVSPLQKNGKLFFSTWHRMR